jgi:hypothetical protein
LDPSRGEKSDMSTSYIESLELRALDQRNRIHKTTEDLKTKVAAVREHLDMSKNAREHLIKASVVVSLLGFFSGYGLAGRFTER